MARTEAEKSKDDAKSRKMPRALKEAHGKVKEHVEKAKPGADTPRVPEAPESNPSA